MEASTVSTISAFAAAAAAGAAAAVAAVQLTIGLRQSRAALLSADATRKSAEAATKNAESAGRHAVAAFRQKWIDTLRDTIAEYHSIVMTVSTFPFPEEHDRKLSQLGTKIELLLNPTESSSDDLLRVKEKIRDCPDIVERVAMDPELVAAARVILKAEWEKVKAELQA